MAQVSPINPFNTLFCQNRPAIKSGQGMPPALVFGASPGISRPSFSSQLTASRSAALDAAMDAACRGYYQVVARSIKARHKSPADATRDAMSLVSGFEKTVKCSLSCAVSSLTENAEKTVEWNYGNESLKYCCAGHHVLGNYSFW